MTSYRKILAIKLRALGDTVLLTAPLQELRRSFPGARIDVAATHPWSTLLEGHPAINRVWHYERHRDGASRAKALARLALKLRAESYDCVLNFHASPSSATLAFATGAKTRAIHFHGHGERNRHSTVTVPGKGILKPIIERDMDVVRALGVSVPEGRTPCVSIPIMESDAAIEWLKRRGLTSPVLAIGLGASRPAKRWPPERYARIATDWCKSTGGSAVALVGPGEEALLRDFEDAVNEEPTGSAAARAAENDPVRSRVVPASGLTVRQTAALLYQCAVFVGNDSGPKHLAVAVDIPTVTLFGPEDPFEWHPYPKDLHPYFFMEGLPCRRDALPGMPPWCGIDVCTGEKHQCMTRIPVGEVLAACRRVARDTAELLAHS